MPSSKRASLGRPKGPVAPKLQAGIDVEVSVAKPAQAGGQGKNFEMLPANDSAPFPPWHSSGTVARSAVRIGCPHSPSSVRCRHAHTRTHAHTHKCTVLITEASFELVDRLCLLVAGRQ